MTALAIPLGPDAFTALGAVAAQAPVVESPLPGGAATAVRFLLQTVPQGVQIGGVVLAVGVAMWVVVLLWRRRATVRHWLVTRRRVVQTGLGAAAALTLVGMISFSAASWNYMQHDNGFCTGCHVMGPAYQRFVQSEHDSLSCHDCHQQSIFASARQLYLWVAERPERIGPHARVPSPVCERCHVTGEAKKTWQRIASTAGHRTHLESDSSVLRDVQCITCHGVEVHRFAPVDSTCAQANCHVSVEIKLAKMRDQTDLHCVTCHQFTADVPALATRDSASGTLVPSMKQCFSCHQMRTMLATFDPARDPHQGTCGMCHNPHVQSTSAEAAKTCTSSACHATWRAEPFHAGANHRAVAQSCILCHQPHAARVDASDCAGCHRAVQGRREHGRTLRPPLPFDTTRSLRRISLRSAPRHGVRRADTFFFASWRGGQADWRPPADSFSHARHNRLACITCHTSDKRASGLTFQPPRGCQICHHQAPRTANCAACHQAGEIAPVRTVTLRVAVAGHSERRHPAIFAHAAHGAIACVACHTVPVTLEPAPSVASCTGCHADHHTGGRQCAPCHAIASDDSERRAPHAPPADAHTRCGACHTPATIAQLVPDRPMCLTCHLPQRSHYPDRECTVCHFQLAPDAFRALLGARSAPAP